MEAQNTAPPLDGNEVRSKIRWRIKSFFLTKIKMPSKCSKYVNQIGFDLEVNENINTIGRFGFNLCKLFTTV